MPNRNVNLPEHFDRLINTGIRTGRFLDTTDAIVEGLRLLEERELGTTPMDALRTAAGLRAEELDVADGIEFECVGDFLELLLQFGIQGSAPPVS